MTVGNGLMWDFPVIRAGRVRRQVLPEADNLCSHERTDISTACQPVAERLVLARKGLNPNVGCWVPAAGSWPKLADKSRPVDVP